MEFEWANSEISTKSITIYQTNITLNRAACTNFENVSYVLLGVDRSNNMLGIKPVTKKALEQDIYHNDKLHKISIGKSYGRISNKAFIETLSQEYNLDLTNNKSIKLNAKWDVVHQILLAEL